MAVLVVDGDGDGLLVGGLDHIWNKAEVLRNTEIKRPAGKKLWGRKGVHGTCRACICEYARPMSSFVIHFCADGSAERHKSRWVKCCLRSSNPTRRP